MALSNIKNLGLLILLMPLTAAAMDPTTLVPSFEGFHEALAKWEGQVQAKKGAHRDLQVNQRQQENLKLVDVVTKSGEELPVSVPTSGLMLLRMQTKGKECLKN